MRIFASEPPDARVDSDEEALRWDLEYEAGVADRARRGAALALHTSLWIEEGAGVSVRYASAETRAALISGRASVWEVRAAAEVRLS